MERTLARTLADYLPDAEFMDDYSGRGMYGKTTCAITTDTRDPAEIASAWAWACRANPDLNPNAISGLRWDNMGLGYVWY